MKPKNLPPSRFRGPVDTSYTTLLPHELGALGRILELQRVDHVMLREDPHCLDFMRDAFGSPLAVVLVSFGAHGFGVDPTDPLPRPAALLPECDPLAYRIAREWGEYRKEKGLRIDVDVEVDFGFYDMMDPDANVMGAACDFVVHAEDRTPAKRGVQR
jgi:hypothetical protein